MLLKLERRTSLSSSGTTRQLVPVARLDRICSLDSIEVRDFVSDATATEKLPVTSVVMKVFAA